ncbi:MAG: type III-A CRISPR-associated RAMP protein Csm5 [Candidatus Aenigmarchaeota archaeon]|nr:type III-A CRISPR-associated RAMP protein Csm5 [Candidatus Aenigmarchaeota archaeon]
MEKAEFSIENITPLHISSGNIAKPIEYFYEDGFIHVCDFNKIIDFIFKKEENIENVSRKIIDVIKRNGLLEDILKEINLYDRRKEFVVYKIKGPPEKTQIKLFMRHGKNLYIPGSSIKGAIRTSILFEKLKDSKNYLLNFSEKDFNNYSEKYNFSVSDIEGNFQSELLRINRLGMQQNKASKLDSAEFINIRQDHKIKCSIVAVKNLTIKEIINFTNQFYYQSLKRIIDMDSLKKYPKVIENLKIIMDIIKNREKDEMILQLGFGGNYFTKSFGSLLVEIYNDKNLYALRKSRKISKPFGIFPKTFTTVNDTQPGWIKMKMIG